MSVIGTCGVQCPCGVVVDVPVNAEIVADQSDGLVMEFEPDYADLWAHSFTHDDERST